MTSIELAQCAEVGLLCSIADITLCRILIKEFG
jgi:hypothetical protein